MKKSTSFRLSNEAYEQLNNLSDRYNKPFTFILEMLIADRASISDQQKNKERRRNAWNKYQQEHDLDQLKSYDVERIYIAGYNRGWVDFQTRHGEDKFIIES
jgi:predicted transcriptional regulator